MKKTLFLIIIACLLLAIASSGTGTSAALPEGPLQTRCGWLSNPTPANVSLFDRDGEWIIGVQGGYQTPGDWPWPKFKAGQWVKTNVNYGYGCACLRVRVDRESSEVREITSASARTLATCRNDPALKKWKRMLE